MTEAQTIEHLNTDCRCITLDLDALCRAAETEVGDPAFCRDLAVTHPNLLSHQPLFLTPAHATRMRTIITAIEVVARLPAYQAAVLAPGGVTMKEFAAASSIRVLQSGRRERL